MPRRAIRPATGRDRRAGHHPHRRIGPAVATRVILSTLVGIVLALIGPSMVMARSPLALGYSHDPAQGQDLDMSVVDATIAELGATPALWSLWSNWGSRGGEPDCLPDTVRCAFPSAAAAGLRERGITPLIWWAPVAPPGLEHGQYSRYVRIIRGYHDDYIRAWATGARAFGTPIVLRIAHEMNGAWYPWGVARFDNTPARFRQAWRHIWRIFQAVGATNVRFLWSPAREDCHRCVPDLSYRAFYPGDRYVDYVGLNAYNKGQDGWRSMAAIVARPLARLRQLTRSPAAPLGKPVILAEVGTSQLGGDKAAWISDGFAAVARRWPQVRAIVYFDVDMRRVHDPDWRLLASNEGGALRAFREVAQQDLFAGRVP